MKEKIEVFNYADKILNSVKKGALLTTKADGKVNSMVISWGMLGIEWSKPIFVVLVRENRFTKQQLDKNPEFTINIPIEKLDSEILTICGTKSGHDINKIEELKLEVEESKFIDVPGIKNAPLTLECKVIYKQKQDPGQITRQNNENFYPQDIDSSYHGANKDYHVAYYGEIVNAYIIK